MSFLSEPEFEFAFKQDEESKQKVFEAQEFEETYSQFMNIEWR